MIFLLVPTILRAFRWKAGLAAVVPPGEQGCVVITDCATGDVLLTNVETGDALVSNVETGCVRVTSEAC